MATMNHSDVEDDECCSEASSVLNNGSVVSTVPDRHGFLGGSQYSPEPYVFENVTCILYLITGSSSILLLLNKL